MAFLPVVQKAARGVVDFLHELAQVGAPKPEVPTLRERLLQVMAVVDFLEKSGKNIQNGKLVFKFVSHDAVVTAVSNALVENGVGFSCEITGFSTEQVGTTDKHKPVYRTFVFTKYTFSSADTSESITCCWMGDAINQQDKGLYNAITQSKKTFLLNFFLTATGDANADSDNSPEIEYRGMNRRNQRDDYSRRPTARPNNSRNQDGDRDDAASKEVESNARRAAIGRIKALAPGTGVANMDWDEVKMCISMMHAPGPFNAESPGFTGWSLNQLTELGNLIESETPSGPSAPPGGRKSWD